MAAGVLAIGIGLSAAMFALTDPFLLRPLPFARPEQLVVIDLSRSSLGARAEASTDPLTPTVDNWRARRDLFSDVAALSFSIGTAHTGGGDVDIPVLLVTPNFFEVLDKARAVPFWSAGRLSGEVDSPLFLTSIGRRRLSADAAPVGSLLRAGDKRSFRLVGVIPDSFLVPDVVFGSASQTAAVAQFLAGRIVPRDGCCILTMIARLAPGASVDTVRHRLGVRLSTGTRLEVHVEQLADVIVGDMRPIALAGMSAAFLVLATALGNIINLRVARIAYQDQEFATRRALGASSFHIFRIIAAEAALVSAAGAVLGAGLAQLALAELSSFVPAEYTQMGQPTLDSRAAAFMFLAWLAAIGAALVPCLLALGSGLQRAWRQGRRMRLGFAAVQTSLAMVLAVGAGMLVESYIRLVRQDTGYDKTTISVPVNYDSALSGPWISADVRSTLTELLYVPGVGEAAAVQGSVVDTGQSKQAVSVGGTLFLEDCYRVTPTYFGTVGTAVAQGRALNSSDRDQRAVVVNMAFARAHWPNGEPVGQVVTFPSARPNTPATVATVVGVVRDALAHGLAVPATPTMYLVMNDDVQHFTQYVIRPLQPAPDYGKLYRAILRVDPAARIGTARALGDRFTDSVRDRVFATLILTLFCSASGVIAVSAIAGIVVFLVTRRSREIAVRLALGASRRRVISEVAHEAVVAAVIGGTAGLFIGRWGSLGLRGLVFGIEAGNWMTTTATGLIALSVVLVAGLVPAARAAGLDPSRLLRID